MKYICVLWGNEIEDYEMTEDVFLMKNAPEKIKKENLKEGEFLILNRLTQKTSKFVFINKKFLEITRLI
jgi:hypothetical protein